MGVLIDGKWTDGELPQAPRQGRGAGEQADGAAGGQQRDAHEDCRHD